MTAAENLMLPYYHFASPHNVWSDFDPFSANREVNFDRLRDTRPYAPRQRWFRTLNDICLFVQYKAKGTPPPPRKLGAGRPHRSLSRRAHSIRPRKGTPT